jgi:sugar lactone lactonase YvrE
MSHFRLAFAALTALPLFILPLGTVSVYGATPTPQTIVSKTFGPRGSSKVLEQRRGSSRLSIVSHAGQVRGAVASNSGPGGSGIIETLAGAAPFQQPQTALTASIGSISGIATDTNGNTFVAAEDFRSVLKIDSAGNVTVYAGQPLASGPLQSSGDGGPATAATFVSPHGLAIDSAGNLYIADQGSFTVRMVAASTGIITTVAGTPGKSGSSADGTLAVDALLEGPSSVAVDASGNIFLADAGLLERVDHGTGTLSQYAGTSGFCQALSNTQTCPITEVELVANFWPGSITISKGYLYVAALEVIPEFLSYTNAILSVQLSTGTTRLLAGGGPEAPSVPGNTAIGANIDPLSLAVDASGNVDFTEGSGLSVSGASTIMQLPVNGTSLTTIAGTGQVGSTGDGGPATAAQILSALSITVAPSGNILFTEPSRVRSIDTGGKIATFAGNGTANYFGDGGPAPMAGISSAQDTIVDAEGNLYIADTGNGVVRRVDASTGIITTIAGNGGFANYQQGNTSTTSLPGDGGPATQTPLGAPSALALGTGANLYIGDFYQGIRVVNLTTGIITTLNSQLAVRGTIAFDGQRSLYTTNEQYIEAVDTTSGASTVVAGNGANSFTYPGDSYGDGGPATDAFIFPSGLALDNAGNLYIADSLENGIRIVNLSTGVINVYAGGYPAGTPTNPGSNFGYSGDGGPASAATFRFIAGLHLDGAGDLVMADTGNAVIREINLSSTIINTVVGSGSPGYSGDGASATAAMLNYPYASTADTTGNLYVSDFNNDRIRRVVEHPAQLSAVLTTPSTSVTIGSSVMLTATVSGISYGIAPMGVATFYDGTTALGAGTLSSSTDSPGEYVATLTTSTLAAGSHSITVQLGADTNYHAVTSAAVAVTVVNVPAVTLSSQSLTFTAQSVGSTSAAQAVMLTNSGTAVLTITSIAASGDFAETNTCGASVAAGANCTISITFSPTAPGAQSGVLTITDNAADGPQMVALSGEGATVAVSSSSTGLTVTTAGGTTTAPIQVASVSGFTGTVNLKCAVSYLGAGTPNDLPTCSLNPASAQFTGSSSASTSSTLTVTTTAASMSAANLSEGGNAAAALAALFFLGLLPRRRWRERVLIAALCLVVSTVVLGCGGGNSPNSGGSSNAGTSAGSYQVMVTATSGTVTSTATIPLSVQ